MPSVRSPVKIVVYLVEEWNVNPTASLRLARPLAVLIAVSLSAAACSGADEDTGLAATEISSGEIGEAERGDPAEGLDDEDLSESGSGDESAPDEGSSDDAESGSATEGAGADDEESEEDTDDDNGGSSANGQPDVPGEPLDFGPAKGTKLIVVGVMYDDTLNFRVDPSPKATIVSTAAPLASADIVAAGEAWSAPGGVWWKVSIGGNDAWANQKFLGMEGNVINELDAVEADLGTLEFGDLREAALTVANSRASDSDPTSRVQFAEEPLAFDTATGSVVVDVLDLGDDSVKGERLRIWVENIYDESSGDEGAQDLIGVEVISVEATSICGRGVSDEGLCS